jgi:hypothetical protein
MICQMMQVTLVNKFRPIRWYKEEEQEEAIADAFLETDFPFQSGKWVLFAFAINKTKKHYVSVSTSAYCEICKKGEEHFNIYLATTDDISEMESEDVLAFLPEPVEGRRGDITFPVSFSGLRVLKFVFYLLLLSLSSILQICSSFMILMSFFILG